MFLKGVLKLIQGQNIGHILFGVDDAFGDEVNGFLKFLSGAGNTAGQADLMQDGAIQCKRIRRRHGVADHHDFTAGFHAVHAGGERLSRADSLENDIKAALGDLLHL